MRWKKQQWKRKKKEMEIKRRGREDVRKSFQHKVKHIPTTVIPIWRWEKAIKTLYHSSPNKGVAPREKICQSVVLKAQMSVVGSCRARGGCMWCSRGIQWRSRWSYLTSPGSLSFTWGSKVSKPAVGHAWLTKLFFCICISVEWLIFLPSVTCREPSLQHVTLDHHTPLHKSWWLSTV